MNKFANPFAERRRESRLVVEVPGSYREADGPAHEIVFGAISAGGCRLSKIEPHLAVGDVVSLHLGAIGPVLATIRWRDDTAAGVEFHEALEPEVVEFFATFCGAAT